MKKETHGSGPKLKVENYQVFQQILNALSDAAFITVDHQIILCNPAAEALEDQLVGSNILSYLKEYGFLAEDRLNQVLEKQSSTLPYVYEIHKKDGTSFYAEVTSSYLELANQPAILTLARDVTKRSQEVRDAARLQKTLLTKELPAFDHAQFKATYIAANKVSGDFYFIEASSPSLLTGILGDVSGKGVKAAMQISALQILFREALNKTRDLQELVTRLNEKVGKFLPDYYVAAIFFQLDLTSGLLRVSAAGINEFTTMEMDDRLRHHTLQGPHLGMFHHLTFDQVDLPLAKVKRIFLWSDGFSPFLKREDIKEYLRKDSLFELNHKMGQLISKQKDSIEGLVDDTTLLSIGLNYHGQTLIYTLEGLADYTHVVPKILQDLSLGQATFAVQLVLMELITNAYKHGNMKDSDLPIRLELTREKNHLIIEVIDLGLIPKNFTIKTSIADEDLYEESGRGLYIVQELSERIYYNDKSVIVEMMLEGS